MGFVIPKEDFSITSLNIQAARREVLEITLFCAFLMCDNLL